MALRIEKCIATPTAVAIFFSESIESGSMNAGISFLCPASPIAFAPLTPASYESHRKIRNSNTTPGKSLPMGALVVVTVNKSLRDGSGKAFKPDGIHNVCTAWVNGGDGGDNGTRDNGERVGFSDLQSYPVLTEEVPAGMISGAAGPAMGRIAGGPSTLGQTADQAIREVLSLRTRTDDPKGFVAALNQAFDLKQVEGRSQWTWTPRSYTVQTELGAITGAQASIYARAKVALDQSLPLLDGVYPLLPNVEPEDLASVQAVVRTQFTTLVNEFGVVGGPRVPRVDELFELLLGPGTPTDPRIHPRPRKPGPRKTEIWSAAQRCGHC